MLDHNSKQHVRSIYSQISLTACDKSHVCHGDDDLELDEVITQKDFCHQMQIVFVRLRYSYLYAFVFLFVCARLNHIFISLFKGSNFSQAINLLMKGYKLKNE